MAEKNWLRVQERNSGREAQSQDNGADSEETEPGIGHGDLPVPIAGGVPSPHRFHGICSWME